MRQPDFNISLLHTKLWGAINATPGNNGGKITFTPATQCNNILAAVLSSTSGQIYGESYSTEGARITSTSNGTIEVINDWHVGIQQTFRYMAIAI